MSNYQFNRIRWPYGYGKTMVAPHRRNPFLEDAWTVDFRKPQGPDAKERLLEDLWLRELLHSTAYHGENMFDEDEVKFLLKSNKYDLDRVQSSLEAVISFMADYGKKLHELRESEKHLKHVIAKLEECTKKSNDCENEDNDS